MGMFLRDARNRDVARAYMDGSAGAPVTAIPQKYSRGRAVVETLPGRLRIAVWLFCDFDRGGRIGE
jgi:hypothetical protein